MDLEKVKREGLELMWWLEDGQEFTCKIDPADFAKCETPAEVGQVIQNRLDKEVEAEITAIWQLKLK